MKRRSFLNTLGSSAVLLSASPTWNQEAAQVKGSSNFDQIRAIQPGDFEAYFSEERLLQNIDVIRPLPEVRFETIAYNFPSWHPSPVMEKLFCKGWTEFETLKNSKALFPGHLFPKYPLWGFFNEAEPAWAEKEIDTAAQFGIDAWMIDWYWHEGTMFYQEQLENGFLKASNREKLKFAVMWANHHWKNVYPARSVAEASTMLPQAHNQADMMKVTEYCIRNYFSQPNYWRIDGRPVFAIFDVSLLLQSLSADQLKKTFDQMRERTLKSGLGELHLQASHVYDIPNLRDLGFDSATRYHTFGWTYGGRPAGERSPYGDGAVETIKTWKKDLSQITIPYFPDCPVGWDDSPRFGATAHMVTGRTPDQYERLLRAAQHFSADSPTRNKIIFLSSWNEWTEDHVLLPDSVYGYSYLEAVKRVFRK